LLLFTGAIITAPIATYFLSLHYVFSGKLYTGYCSFKESIYAGISAVVVVNLLLAAYIIVAVLEDSQDGKTLKEE
jgi:hypothetical protein